MNVTMEAEFNLWQRLVDPDNPTLSPAAAQAILSLEFPVEDQSRMVALAAKARAGELTPEELPQRLLVTNT